jgi:diguanylate cyclase (GGDEF)-like protein
MPTTNIQQRFLSLLDSLSAVRRFSEVNLMEVSEQELLEGALSVLVEHQDMAYCSLFLPDQEEVLRCAVGMELGEQLGFFQEDQIASEMTFVAGEGIMGVAYQSGTIQYCHNCARDERFKPFPAQSLFRGHGSIVSVPVSSAGKVLAVLNVSHHHPDFFESWQQHMLILFSNILGHTLSSHRLIHALELEVQNRTEQLELALAESERQRKRCQDLSFIDGVTGLHNQRFFQQEGSSRLARAIRFEQSVTVLLVSIDHLQNIRNERGDGVGDLILRSVAEELGRLARACDMVARLEDESFALILSDTDPSGAEVFSERLQKQVGELRSGKMVGDGRLTVSIGIAGVEGPLEGIDPGSALQQLYLEAQQALQQCQQKGGDLRRLFGQ